MQVYGNAGKQLFKDVMYLKSLINVEHKFRDGVAAALVIGDSTAPQQILVNGMAQGSSENTRTGISIKVTELIIRYSVAVSTYTPVNVRFLVVVDASPNGALFAVTDLFEDTVTGTNYVNSQFSVDNKQRFSILYDETFFLNAVAFTTHEIQEQIPWEHHVEYNDTNSAGIAGVNKWALYVYALSDSTATPANGPTLTGSSRINYIDN
jgi:hypothetical protein